MREGERMRIKKDFIGVTSFENVFEGCWSVLGRDT